MPNQPQSWKCSTWRSSNWPGDGWLGPGLYLLEIAALADAVEKATDSTPSKTPCSTVEADLLQPLVAMEMKDLLVLPHVLLFFLREGVKVHTSDSVFVEITAIKFKTLSLRKPSVHDCTVAAMESRIVFTLM